MPTPRPIIATIWTVKSGIDRTCESSVTNAAPVARPTTAVPIGRPIASTEPKARIRMIIAAINPYSSEAGSSNSPKISPPYSIVNPSMATSSSNSWTSSEKSRISVWSRSVMLTWAKAIVPSGLI